MHFIMLTVEDLKVVVYSEVPFGNQSLTEARTRGTRLVGPYSYEKHKAHIPQGEEHLHVYLKNNQLFAVNKGGTAHDASHGASIPNRVAKALRTSFPKWTFPKNNILEQSSDLGPLLLD